MRQAQNRRRRFVRHALGGSVSGLALGIAAPAHAQSQPAPDAVGAVQGEQAAQERNRAQAGEEGAAAEDSAQLQEIIVTAQRRPEPLQEVPISITAFDNREIQRRGVTDLRQLEFAIPNVQFQGIRQSSNASISIRGIEGGNFGGSSGFETGLAVYLDGVFLGSTAAFDQNLNDIERVEVLRGPQGTLFGRNAVAGALNYISRRPTDEFEFNVGGQVGSYDLLRGNAMVSGPLVPGVLAGKISVVAGRQDGFVRNIFDDSRLDNDNYHGGRLQLRATPSDNLEILLSADGFRQRRRANFVGEIEDGSPGAVPGPRTTNVNTIPRDDREFGGVALNVDWRIGDHTLTSITAYRAADASQVIDNDVTPASFIVSNVSDEQHQFSQELRLASPQGQRLEYVLGLFYFDQRTRQDAIFNLGQPFFALFGLGALFPNGASASNFVDIGTESLAAFGQLDFHVTDALTISVGGRYTNDTKTLDRFEQNVPVPLNLVLGIPNIPSATDEIEDDDFSPMAAIEHAWTPNLRTYFRAASGYKPGGFNTRLIPSFATIAFGSENITTYELGLKSELFNRRLRLNAAAFYSDYSNLQRLQFDVATNVSAFTNNAQAEVKGFEIEFLARPTRQLTLSGGLGYNDARYTDFPGGGFLNGNPINLRGERLSGVPNWTGNFSAQYAQPIRNFADLVVRADYAYRSPIQFQSGLLNNGVEINGDTLHRINARAGLVGPDSRWEVFAFVDNLTDEDHVLTRGRTLFFNAPVISYREPRTFGIQAQVRF